MLQNSLAFSSFSVDDIAKAKQFYAETLGVKVEEIPEGLRLKLNGTEVFVYPKPDHVPATFTILNFVVEDLEQVVDELASKGVEFEKYDSEYMKTNEKGIADQGPRQMAWFKDPAGNFLSLIHEG